MMRKFSKNEMIKSESGITLTILVITVIVMLILVGASIATISGNEGIITQTRTTVNNADAETAINDVKIAVAKMAILWDGNDDTIKDYIIEKLSSYEDGYKTESGAKITVVDTAKGIIKYIAKDGEEEDKLILKIDDDGNVVLEKDEWYELTKV